MGYPRWQEPTTTVRWVFLKRSLSPSMPKSPTSRPSRSEGTGIDRLYKRVGVRKISYYYQYSDGKRETLTTAIVGDRGAIADAERIAKRKALDIQEGQVTVGSVAAMIERFKDHVAPSHFLDQSKDGLAVRQTAYNNLTKFFGKMRPMALETLHGYQYLDARAVAGAPAKANKEMSLMATVCNFAIRWGVMRTNPFVGMMLNKTEKDVRTSSRSQIVQFYLWSLRQPAVFRNLGCAAMFTYLTGFRPAEVRPFRVAGLSPDGVRVLSAKRKKGNPVVMKLREWSPKLRAVVARAQQTHKVPREFLFANLSGQAYSRSGWGSIWSDAMFAWIATYDAEVAVELARKKQWEMDYKRAHQRAASIPKYESTFKLVDHSAYFALQDVRPAAITTKLRNRNIDAYDFAAHANPSTTHKHYDRRQEKKATPTE